MIAIGSDHGGYKLKEEIKAYFSNIDFKDFGTFSDELMNFPDVAFPLAESVAREECDKGILVCRSGIGMTIAANKVDGIRCALCYSDTTAKSAKEYTNANIIAIGADELNFESAKNIIEIWLSSEFLGGRYQERNELIKKYEVERKR